MLETIKQRLSKNIKEEIGDRSGIRIFLLYVSIFFGNFGIVFTGFLALIFAAWLSVIFHILPAEEAGKIAGILLVGWLYLMLGFYCTKTGYKFIARVGEEIEKSIVDAFNSLCELPIQPLLQVVKFIRINETAVSFIPSTPFIPPRLHLA